MSDRDALIAALSPDTVIAPEHMAEALYLARQEVIRLTGDRDRLASLLADAEAAKSDTALCAEIDHLRHLLEKLKPYLRHRGWCYWNIDKPCFCGLSDLLTEIDQ